MWASPNRIPINTSFVSSGIKIFALSRADNFLIPFVEIAFFKERLGKNK
jgi:hypothetical protein